MPELKCEEVLNVDTISHAFLHTISELTNRIHDCLFRCYRERFTKWAAITYTGYPPQKLEEVADLAFTDSIFKLTEKAAAGKLYNSGAAFKTVFHNFFRFQLLSYLQKEQRLHKKEADLEEKHADSMAVSESSEQADDSFYQLLEKALLQMEPKDRQIIEWRHYDKKPPDEIARLLDISKEAASNRIWRCMERLRNSIDELKKKI